jgi:O-antigen ligase
VETLMAAGVARTVLTDIWSPWFAATIVALLGAAGLVALIVFKNAKKRQRRRDLEDS